MLVSDFLALVAVMLAVDRCACGERCGGGIRRRALTVKVSFCFSPAFAIFSGTLAGSTFHPAGALS